MPDTSDPPEPTTEPTSTPSHPSEISHSEFHIHADQFLEKLLSTLEIHIESAPSLDAEYSAGVLQITTPDIGIYVLNKQPVNKQIWLSSPISGPKRYDWVVTGESMHEKQGAGSGDWVYLRDNSTLTGLLKKELGIDVDIVGDKEVNEADVHKR
jgi:frataxin